MITAQQERFLLTCSRKSRGIPILTVHHMTLASLLAKQFVELFPRQGHYFVRITKAGRNAIAYKSWKWTDYLHNTTAYRYEERKSK